MNYNPYGGYGLYQQPAYNQLLQQQPNNYTNYQQNQAQGQNQQNMQTFQQYLPITFVNGVVGAKSFIVQPNQTIYLRDSDNEILFEKKADNQGRMSLRAWELKEIIVDDIGKNKDSSTLKINNADLNNFVNKRELSAYAMKEDISNLKDSFEAKIENILSKIEKLNKNDGDK